MGAGASALTPRSKREQFDIGMVVLYERCATKADERMTSRKGAVAFKEEESKASAAGCGDRGTREGSSEGGHGGGTPAEGGAPAADTGCDGGKMIQRNPRLILHRPSLEHVPISDVEVWREAFDLIDTEQKGELTERELAQLFKKLERDVDEKRLTQMIKDVDKAGNCTVDFESFCSMMKNQFGFGAAAMEDDTTLKDAFSHFDSDQDGYITEGELRNAVFKLFGPMEDVEVQAMLAVAMGHSTSGQIDYATFKHMLTKDDEEDGDES